MPIGHPLRLAVDGITASGKTTFSQEVVELVRERGRPCVHVSMDGFHNPRALRYRQGRDSAAGYYEDAYDYAALHASLLDPLGDGGDRRYRTATYDLTHDAPALAARHGRTLAPDELLDPSVLPHVLAATGWIVERIDDADDRYLALARVADRIGP